MIGAFIDEENKKLLDILQSEFSVCAKLLAETEQKVGNEAESFIEPL
jgi:hypothetical protein